MAGIDWSECPIVQCDPEKLGGVPTVRAYRVSADSVVQNHDDDMSAEEIAYQFTLPIEDVRAVIQYAEKARQVAHTF